MTRFFSAVLFLLITLPGSAQDYKRTFNWYFGDSAGINFATTPPTALNNGAMYTYEGCASISDTNGNLLFYTNGEKVWNKNHEIMEMGDSLLGSTDATQSSIIIPQPGVDSIYYVFTTPARGNSSSGLRFAVVNMRVNGGLGKVTIRNTKLQSSMSEKLTATFHQNGKDIWIVTHGFKEPGKDNLFYSYLLTENGLINCPVLNNIGAEHYKYDESFYNARGGMKFSPDGKRLAVCVYNEGQKYVELFDFDKSTGTLSNLKRITDVYFPYGIEFSPNGNVLYVATALWNRLYQYNISLPNAIDIQNSRVEIFYPGFLNKDFLMELQLAPNGKIYIALVDSTYISVINQPDSLGMSCNFQLNGFQLSSQTTSLAGLPNFVRSYFRKPEPDFQYSIKCVGNIGTFSPHNVTGVQKWSIKKTGSTISTTYTSSTVQHTFNDSGGYSVTLYTTNNDTITRTIFIDAPILPQADTLGCGVDSVVLNIPSSYRCLQWSDTSAQFYSRAIKTSGTYTIQGYNSQGCLIKDSIRINFTQHPLQPIISKMNDSLLCSVAFSYQWFLNDTVLTNSTTQKIKPIVAGLYKVMIMDSNGCANISSPFSSNVGIEFPNSNSIKVYPNPAKEVINIEVGHSIYDLKIHDISGRDVYFKTGISNPSHQVESKNLSKGLYFIQINTNNKTYHQKIIIN